MAEAGIALSTGHQEAVCQPWRSVLFIHYVCNFVVVYTLQHKCLFTLLTVMHVYLEQYSLMTLCGI